MIMNHKIDWENKIILKVKTDYNKRLFIESWFINSKSNVINKNGSNSFPLVYKKLLDCNGII